jgi:cell division topological specificity factor
MLTFFDRLFGRKSHQNKDRSSQIAKDRLQFVLVQDRINMTSDKLQAMKQEIIEVISKYVSVDLENVDFALTNRERDGLLIAEIPFTQVEDTNSDTSTEEDSTTPTEAIQEAPTAETDTITDEKETVSGTQENAGDDTPDEEIDEALSETPEEGKSQTDSS